MFRNLLIVISIGLLAALVTPPAFAVVDCVARPDHPQCDGGGGSVPLNFVVVDSDPSGSKVVGPVLQLEGSKQLRIVLDMENAVAQPVRTLPKIQNNAFVPDQGEIFFTDAACTGDAYSDFNNSPSFEPSIQPHILVNTSSGGTAQVDQITTVGAPYRDDVWTLTISDPISATTIYVGVPEDEAGGNTANLITKWVAAINNDPVMGGFLTATWDGANPHFEITSNTPGVAFTSSVSVIEDCNCNANEDPDLGVSVSTTTSAVVVEPPEIALFVPSSDVTQQISSPIYKLGNGCWLTGETQKIVRLAELIDGNLLVTFPPPYSVEPR